MPLYALVMPLGSHCPENVLRRAIKAGFLPKQAAALAKVLKVDMNAIARCGA